MIRFLAAFLFAVALFAAGWGFAALAMRDQTWLETQEAGA